MKTGQQTRFWLIGFGLHVFVLFLLSDFIYININRMLIVSFKIDFKRLCVMFRERERDCYL